MSIQEKAFHIIYDIIGIVIRWDKQKLSDKDAMNEIVDILATHGEDEEEFVETRIKKKPFILQKKLVAPLAISVVFLAILFGPVDVIPILTDSETQIPAQDNEISFEQLDEIPSDSKEKIQNKTNIEELSNLTNLN